MKDFIFLIGTSGIGKSTLAQGLMAHYRSTCIEQHMVPEFLTRDGVEEMTGELEERTCWENTRAMALCFHELGYRNVIISDLDDLRTRDIPALFRGYDYLTLKLVCRDPAQLRRQMHGRPAGGLIDDELQRRMSEKMLSRPLLVNEHELDVTGLTADAVLSRAIALIDSTNVLREYDYEPPDRSLFYSWVFSNGLR